jgi:anthranilate 1,2-dioxygenase small subunit
MARGNGNLIVADSSPVQEAPISEALRLRLEALQRDYVACLDDGRLDDWPEFFTDDCTYQIISRDSHARGEVAGFWFCDSKGMLRDRILYLRESSIRGLGVTRHILGGTRLLAWENDVVRSETSYLVVRTSREGEPQLFATGRYLDTVDIQGSVARFKEKLVLTDSSRIDMAIAAPV